MQRIHAFATVLLLAGCSAEKTPSASPKFAPQPPAAPAPAPPVPGSQARQVDEKSDLLAFSYGWPAEADALPRLKARFEEEMAKDRADALRLAEADRKERQDSDIPFNPYDLSKTWSVAGETPLLLALSAETYSFTGGAHGNTGYETLVWAKREDVAVDRAVLFPLHILTQLTPPYCDALDRAREEKRGEPVPKDRKGMFNECPELGKQALTPVDGDDDGRFDAVGVLIGPYEAGPYVEGTYELELPIDAAILAAIPDAYRDQFEVRAKR